MNRSFISAVNRSSFSYGHLRSRSLNQIIPSFAACRFQSTDTSSASTPVKQLTNEEAREKALNFLKIFPGETLAKKTAYFTTGSAAVAVAIMNDLYIYNPETLYFVSFVTFCRLLYLKTSPIAAKYVDDISKNLKDSYDKFVKSERKEFEERIAELTELRQFQDYVREYIKVEQENIDLQVKLQEILQINANANAIKAALDERVRIITEEREEERKKVLSDLLSRVEADLKDPKTQQDILKSCLDDLASLGQRKLVF